MRCNVKWNSQWNSPGLPVIFRPSAATLESSGCTHRFESNIYATECMGSSAHKSIHPLEYQLALSYQICRRMTRYVPSMAGTPVYLKRKEHKTMHRTNSISPSMRTRRRVVKAVRRPALLDRPHIIPGSWP